MAVEPSLDPDLLVGLRKAAKGAFPPLSKGGKTPIVGLFPSGAAGKQLVSIATQKGYLTIRAEKVKSGTRSTTTQHGEITPAGLQFLADVDSPKAALEALLPVVQKLGSPSVLPDPAAFRDTVEKAAAECVRAIREAFAGLQQKVVAVLTPTGGASADPGPVLAALRTALEKVEPVVVHLPAPTQPVSPPPPPPAPVSSGPDVKTLGGEFVALVERSDRERSVGCDFGELYDALTEGHPALTVGTFQDLLRTLDETDRIRLSGWSQMLDDMPRPELALFVSHKVMYYAQLAR